MKQIHSGNQPLQIDDLCLEAWDWRDRDQEKAQTLAKKGQEWARKIYYPLGYIQAQIIQAHLEYRNERYTNALDLAQESVVALMAPARGGWLSRAYLVMAGAYNWLGDLKLATSYYRKALELAEQEGEKVLRAWILNGWGVNALNTDLILAGQLLYQSLAIFRQHKVPDGQAMALYNLAFCRFSSFDDAQTAEKLLMESFEVLGHSDLQLGWHQVYANGLLGAIWANQGKLNEAIEKIDGAIAYARAKYVSGLPLCLLHCGRIFLSRQLYWKALPVLKEALKLNEAVGNLQRTAQCHWLLAQYYREMAQPKRAREHEQKYQELRQRAFQA